MRHGKATRSFVAAAMAVSMLAGASSALAATSPDTTQFAVTGGTLVFTTVPDAPNFPGLTLNGQAQTLNAQMGNFGVSDSTGSASGWNVTVAGDNTASKSSVLKQYCPNATCGTDTGPGYVATTPKTLAQNSITLNSTGAGFSAQNGTTGTAPTHQCNSLCNVDAAPASPVKVVSAASGAGMGSYLTTGYTATSLTANAPSTVQALQTNEVYRVDLLWTLGTGP